MGIPSPWKEVQQSIRALPITINRISRLARGGLLSSSATINSSSGLIDLGSNNYVYDAPGGFSLQYDNATTAQQTQTFSGLTDGQTGYLLFDQSETGSDPWKAVAIYRDTVATDENNSPANQEYLIELGASNNGLTASSGTVSVSSEAEKLQEVAHLLLQTTMKVVLKK